MLLRIFLARLRGLFQNDARLSEELESHLEMLAAEYESKGLPPSEACLAASRDLGSVTKIRESHRELRRFPFIDSFLQDIRYAVRQCIAHKGLATVAIFSFALGIGANTTVLSVVYSVLLRPIPYPESENIVRIVQSRPNELPSRLAAIKTEDLRQWRTQTRTLSQMAGYRQLTFHLRTDLQFLQVKGAAVSPAMFPLLRAAPLLGRTLGPDDENNQDGAVAVIAIRHGESTWGKPLT